MTRSSLRRLLPIFAVIAGLYAARVQAQTTTTTTNAAPVLVYRVQFTGVESSLNFRGFSGGYYIADVNNGASNSGTLILTQSVGSTRRYYQINNFGALFYGSNGKDTQAIVVGNTTSIASTTVSATRTITFFLMGEATDKVELELVNGTINMSIAKELKGRAIFCDSQEDQPFVLAPGQAVGTAAEVSCTFKYDEGQSKYSEQRSAGRADMITKIINELKSDKYVVGN